MKIREKEIGKGRQKICVPITAQNGSMAVEEGRYIREKLSGCVDVVELRIDYLQEVRTEKLTEVLRDMQDVLGEIPLLCTLRTMREGGEINVTKEEYKELLMCCIHSKAIDLLDVEFYLDREVFETLKTEAQKEGIAVIASNHDFQKTPPKDEIVARLMEMERAGASIAKIAVMPVCEEDVLSLLGAQLAAKTCMEIPFIAISMGKMGAISRICGERFGSCMTFGVGRKSSAPGQIDAEKLKEIQELLS